MTGTDKLAIERAALADMLDAFGGDRTRWPAGAEARFAELIARDPQARRAVDEAYALDAVLAKAPKVGAPREAALLDRLMTEVTAMEPRATSAGQRRSAEVIPLRPRAAPQHQRAAPFSIRRAGWQAAAALAASLMIGVIGGASGLLGSSIDDAAVLAGLYGGGDTLSAALGQAVEPVVEEDTL